MFNYIGLKNSSLFEINKLEAQQKQTASDNLSASIYKNIVARIDYELTKAGKSPIVQDIKHLDKLSRIASNKQILNFLIDSGFANDFNFVNFSFDNDKSRFYLKACSFLLDFINTLRLSDSQSKNKGLEAVFRKTAELINFTRKDLGDLMSRVGYKEGAINAHICMFTKLCYLGFYFEDKEIKVFKATDKLKTLIKNLDFLNNKKGVK